MNRPEALNQTLKALADQVSSREEVVEILIGHNGDARDGRQFALPANCILRESFHKKNIGLMGNVAFLAVNATGKFIWFLSDDDVILPNSVGDLLNYLLADDLNFCAGVRWTLDGGSEAVGLDMVERPFLSATDFMARYWEAPVFISCIVLRTSSARKFAADFDFQQRQNPTYPQTILFYHILAECGHAWILKGFAVKDSRQNKLYSQAGAFGVRVVDLIRLYAQSKELFANSEAQVKLGSMRVSVTRSVIQSSVWDLLTFPTRRHRQFSARAFWCILRKNGLGPSFTLAVTFLYVLNLLAVVHPRAARVALFGVFAATGKIAILLNIQEEAEAFRAALRTTDARHFDYHAEPERPS